MRIRRKSVDFTAYKKIYTRKKKKKKKKKNVGTTDQILPGSDAQARALETGRDVRAIVEKNESVRERVRR